MDSLFKIDGRAFSGVGVEKLQRSFRIPNGPNSGEMLSGETEPDPDCPSSAGQRI